MRFGLLFTSLAIGAGATLYVACGGGDNGDGADAGADTDAKTKNDTGVPATSDAGADASIPNLPAAVLTDPKIWTAVPGRQSCALFQANVLPDPFPPRVWGSCGSGAWATGCQVADAGLAIDSFIAVALGQTSGTAIDGDIFIQVAANFSGTIVQQVFRLSDGATVAAARTDTPAGPCLFIGFPKDDPFLLSPGYGFPDGGFIDSFGVAPNSPDAGIAWDQHWVADVGNVNNSFDFDDGHGYAYYGIGIESITSPSATAYTLLDNAPSETSAVARHDLLLWGLSNASGGAVRAYTTAHGVQTLVTTTNGADAVFPLDVALSDDHMAWLTVTENEATAAYDSVQINWSPVARQPADVQITSGPLLTKKFPYAGSLATGGDYVAAGSCDSLLDNAVCVVNVVQMSTQKTWMIPQRPGSNFVIKVLAVDDDELVLGEANAKFDNALRRLLRIKTSQLDALTVH